LTINAKEPLPPTPEDLEILETKDSQILKTNIINNFQTDTPILKDILNDTNNKNLHIDIEKITGE
jgi:hypothetical protein